MENKWQDPIYHATEGMRELQAAEIHLVQYINQKPNTDKLRSILDKIRELRKGLESDVFDTI
jgi:hypothetical protein